MSKSSDKSNGHALAWRGMKIYARPKNTPLIGMTLLLAGLTSLSAWALPDELQVHLDETIPMGKFSLDVVTHTTPSNPKISSNEGLRSSAHLLHISPEFSYGLTPHTQLSVQVFGDVDTSGRSRASGTRIGLKTVFFRPDDDDDDGAFAGMLLEAGRLPRTLSTNRLDSEIKLILGWRAGRWVFALNPEVGVKLAGSGESTPELSARAKVAYRTHHGYSLGLEHYADLGSVKRVGPLNQQSQQTFGVVDFKTQGWEFNVGLGKGWNAYSQGWVAKVIVGIPLPE